MNSCHVISILLSENDFLRFYNACLDIGCFPDSIAKNLLMDFVMDREEKNPNEAKNEF